MKPFQAPRLQSLIALIRQHRLSLSVFTILGVALLFRFWQLWKLPFGLASNEAANGLTALNGQIGGDINHFLLLGWQNIFLKVFGNTALALRFGIAVISLLTILLAYLWLKEWFSKRTALVTCLLMASGGWAVGVGRQGLSAAALSFAIILSAWLITISLRKRRWYLYLLAGVGTAAGFYMDTNYQYVLAALVLILLYYLIWHRQLIRKFTGPLLIMFTGFVVGLAPWLINVAEHQEALATHAVTSFSQPGQLGSNLLKTIGMLNFSGDKNPQQNLAHLPQLNVLVSVLFVLGVMLALRRIKDARYFSLLCILSVALLPAVLSRAAAPDSLAASGAISVIYALAAVGLVELVARWHGVFPRNPAAYWTILGITLLSLGTSVLFDYKRYFVAWANAPATQLAFNPAAFAAADYINAHHTNHYRVLASPAQDQVLSYLTRGKGTYQLVNDAEVKQLRNGELLISLGKHSESSIKNAKLLLSKKSQRLTKLTLFQLLRIGTKP